MAPPKEYLNEPSEYETIKTSGDFLPTFGQMGIDLENSTKNRDTADIPDDINVRFWMTNLPPQCDVKMLLGSIRGYGRIFSCHIVPPRSDDSALPPACAANIAFFELEAAKKFWDVCQSDRGFWVGGQRARCFRHREPQLPMERDFPIETRCLVIKGTPNVVNEQSLTEYFRSKFRFSLDEVRYRTLSRYENILEFRFAGWYGQAQLAHKALEIEQIPGVTSFKSYPDPCAYNSFEELVAATVRLLNH